MGKDLEKLREENPGWHARLSPQGRTWIATRRGPALSWDDIESGLAETVMADTLEQLAAALGDQRHRTSLRRRDA